MSTAAQSVPSLEAAESFRQTRNYLNAEHGLKSWLFTLNHKRMAILYLIGVSFFFLVCGLLTMAIRMELLTPLADLMALDTYNKVFTMHGIVMVQGGTQGRSFAGSSGIFSSSRD
jgi:cytochrome c oxidase subunit 1